MTDRVFRYSGCAWALMGAALAVPGGVRAQSPGRFRFAWARDEGAERCPDGPAIEREVSRRLGLDPFVRSDAPSIEASVRRAGALWTARIVVREATDALVGLREFTSQAPDCVAIASAVTLGVALSIDPEAAMRPPPAEGPSTPAPTAPATPRPPPREIVWARAAGLSLRAVGALGYLPSPSFGVAVVSEGPIKGRWRWGLGLTWLPETRISSDGGTFGFSFFSVALGPCLDLWRARVASLTACAGASLGALRAVVYQGAPSDPGDQLWASAFAGVRFRGRIAGPLGAEVGVSGEVPWVRHRFHDGLNRTVFQQPAVAATAIVGLGLQFQ